ncbi:unnamed protein product [Ranitomeya imitator]|uniref:Replication protein A OB domain-containing protein n=1 Tax=Ranitomeya imitator TaxID=111125 RepID=A0ABN9M455_9NEOB|nr:unnamed protein product [Ranitomeya imitator]
MDTRSIRRALDASGEIRATAFNDQADKFFSLIEVNKVYYFSKGTLKIANKQYTAVKNDYEMTFNSETTVIPCDDSSDVPTVQFQFVPISELESKNKDTLLDVIGVCKSFEEVAKVTIKSNNREVSKRTIHLMDTSGKVVSTTLWGEDADKFDGSRQPVVAIKGARLSDFGGRSLSVLSSSTFMINPDIPEAFKLRGCVGPRKRSKLHFSCVRFSAKKKRRTRCKTQRFCVRFAAFLCASCVASPTQRRATLV